MTILLMTRWDFIPPQYSIHEKREEKLNYVSLILKHGRQYICVVIVMFLSVTAPLKSVDVIKVSIVQSVNITQNKCEHFQRMH